MKRLASLTTIIVVSAIAAGAPPDDVKVRDEIKVPDGHKLVAKYEAKGVQVYKAVPGKGGGFEWQFDEPLADLSDVGKKAGLHYKDGGPAWEAADGSKVVKEKEIKLMLADAPNKESDVPWLRISVKADDVKDAKPGILSKVVYVQRVATSGGVMPKEPPKRADSRIAVPYTATYYFWEKAEAKENPSSKVEFKDGKAAVAGKFTDGDRMNSGGRREKKYAIDGEPGKVYKITREGAGTYWQWITDSEGKLIVQGWPGESAPKVRSYYYQSDKKETFYFFLDGKEGGEFTFNVTSYGAPAPQQMKLKDGKFEKEIEFTESDGVYMGQRQRTFLLKAEKDKKYSIEAVEPGNFSTTQGTLHFTLVVQDSSGKTVGKRDAAPISNKLVVQMPEDGAYRIIIAGMRPPEISDFQGKFTIRIGQE